MDSSAVLSRTKGAALFGTKASEWRRNRKAGERSHVDSFVILLLIGVRRIEIVVASESVALRTFWVDWEQGRFFSEFSSGGKKYDTALALCETSIFGK